MREAKLQWEFSNCIRGIGLFDVLQGIKGIRPEFGSRSEVADQETDTSSTQRVLEDSCQLAITIRNSRGALVERINDLTEDREGLIDGGGLEHTGWVVSSELVVFTSRKVDQVNGTDEGYKIIRLPSDNFTK